MTGKSSELVKKLQLAWTLIKFTQKNEDGGALTDYFHSHSNFEEKKSDDKIQAVVDKPLKLIPVDDFLTLTERKDSLPRVDLAVSIEAVEDLQHENVLVEDDFHEHNSN